MADVIDTIDSNDMVIDTSEFNFLDLDDVVDDQDELGYAKYNAKDLESGKAQTKTAKQKAKEADPELEVAEDPDLEDEDYEEDEVDEDEVEDEDESEEDEDEESDSDDIEVTDEDGEEVDFENYEISLPNGEQVVLKDLVQGYKDATQLNADREEFKKVQEDFMQKSESLTKYLELARLEADKVIDDYADFDWAKYKNDDPVGYVENREFLDLYKRRRSEITEAMEKVEAKRAADERANFEAKAREAGTILARDIPGWNNDLYKELMLFAVENGADANDIANCVDPVVFKMIHKAMQFEKGKQKVVAKVKRLGSPKKVVKASAKPPVQKEDSKKARVAKKLETGNFSEKELSNAFHFLED